MDADEITGRFLPSRVYCRWKWTVRAGLMVVPVLVLLGGGLILFLTPGKYRSTALVEFENARSPQESAEMLKSSAILGRVISDLELAGRLQVDHETARDILTDTIRVKVIPDTRLIEISVTFAQKERARDIAAALPRSLVRFEADRLRDEHAAKAEKLATLTREAEDVYSESAVSLNRIGKIHGQALPDTPAFRELERARRAFQAAEAEVERRRVLLAAAETEIVGTEPRLIVHTEPVISQNPSNPKIGPELDELLIEALAAGLIAALLLPYLGELAFPVRETCQMSPDVVYDL